MHIRVASALYISLGVAFAPAVANATQVIPQVQRRGHSSLRCYRCDDKSASAGNGQSSISRNQCKWPTALGVQGNGW